MDLVDEHDGTRVFLDFLYDLLEAFLEIAAVARSGEKRSHVERKHGRGLQDLGHVVFDYALGEPFGNRRLADARITDEQRIILLPAAKNLDRPADFGIATDQRVNLTFFCLFVEVDAVGIERIGLFLAPFLASLGGRRLVVNAAHRPALRHAGALGDTVADVVDGVVAGHVLLLQEKKRRGFRARRRSRPAHWRR